jgi:hypothetical protein
MMDCVGKKHLGRNPLLKPSVNVRIILKWIVKEEDGKIQSGFI